MAAEQKWGSKDKCWKNRKKGDGNGEHAGTLN